MMSSSSVHTRVPTLRAFKLEFRLVSLASLIGGDPGVCDTWQGPRAPDGRRDSGV